MLSDEEKKAIEYWKKHMEILHWNTQLASEHYIKVLLDLVEKQSKEIEGLIKVSKECIEEKFNNDKKWEDKIKAKIEEYEKILYYAETEEGMAELKDYEYDEAKYGKKVLQSLLDKVPYCDKCQVQLWDTNVELLSSPPKKVFQCPKCNEKYNINVDELQGEWKWRTI